MEREVFTVAYTQQLVYKLLLNKKERFGEVRQGT